MERTCSRGSWIVGAFLAVGCGADVPSSSDTIDAPIAAQRRGTQRPAGWSDTSHGERAGDYARLFRDDVVQRIDIEISEEVAETLDNDLNRRLGPLGSPPGSPASAPAAVAACTGRSQNASCSFLEVRNGRCVNQGRLVCRGPDQEVAIDMVPGDPVMVPVTVRYDGKVWTQVGFRYKGNSSLARPWGERIRKLPFRLDFDKFEDDFPEVQNQRLYGFSKLTFANAYTDPSLIREKLAFDMLRDAGLVAARAAFYRVYVDAGDGPQYWGVYTMVEDPTDQLPAARFSDGSGNLYKPDGTGADFTRFDVRGFEKKSNEDEGDYSDVQRAINALHASRSDAAGWRRQLEQAFDVDAFLGNFAVRMAMDHWDGYGQLAHNYYLYGDPARGGRLVWISWDHNGTWGSRARTTILPTNAGSRWPLITYTLNDSVYRARYLARLSDFVRGPYAKSRFDAHATKLYNLVAPYAVGSSGERAPYTHLRTSDAFRQALAPIVTAADTKRAEINRVTSNGSSSSTSSGTPSRSAEDSEERSSEEDSYEEEYEEEYADGWRMDDPRWQLAGE